MPFSRIVLLVAHVVPALVAVSAWGAPMLFPLGAGLLVIAVLSVLEGGGRFARPVGSLLSTAVVLLGTLFAASWFGQGRGFNERFFYHFELRTLRTAFEVFPVELAVAGAVVLACGLAPLWVRPAGWPGPRVGVLSALLGLVTWPPGLSLAEAAFAERTLPGVVRSDPEFTLPSGRRPRNLVLVYLEGVERSYFDSALFGEVVPSLRRLRDEATDFSGIEQVEGTEWTVAGLVASQCGVPLGIEASGFGANSSLAAVERPLPGYTCLGDILLANGFRTVFMGGADLGFAGKGNFLAGHGFEERLGRRQLLSRLPDPGYRHGWGLFDDSLLDLAAGRFEELHAAGTPFLLTVLTVDTHFPRGSPSASCRALPGNVDPMLDAVFCTDQLIGRFVERIRRADPEGRSLIAIVSDHLSMRTTISHVLEAQPERRLSFFVLDPEQPAREIAVRGTHFDIGPTLLEWMGFEPDRLGLGWSLLRNDPGYWFTLDDRVRRASQADFIGSLLRLDRPIAFEPEGPRIRFGEQSLRVNRAGRPLKKEIFVLRFDSAGELTGLHVVAGPRQYAQTVGDDFAVAVSTSPRFNTRYGEGEAGEGPLWLVGWAQRGPYRSGRVEPGAGLSGEEVRVLFQAGAGGARARAPTPQEP